MGKMSILSAKGTGGPLPTPTSGTTPKCEGSSTKRRTQFCTFCKNHKKEAPKKGHNCPYKECHCVLCELLRKAQITMRHQQRVWRHQKFKLQPANEKAEDLTPVFNEKGQMCDKCRNHNKLKHKKNHQCPYDSCSCQYCGLTFKRRELMKHLQRVRRSNLTSSENPELDQTGTDNAAFSPPKEYVEGDCDDSKGKWHLDSDIEEKSSSCCDENSNGPTSSIEIATNCSPDPENEVELMDSLSPHPPTTIAYSPPPLIPLSLVHDSQTEEGYLPPHYKPPNQDIKSRYEQSFLSLPPLAPPQPVPLDPPTKSQSEETILQASTRILSRLGRIAPKYKESEVPASPPNPPSDFPARWSKPFLAHKSHEMYHNDSEHKMPPRHYRWAASSSVAYTHSVYNTHEMYPEAPISPERQYPLNLSATPIDNPPFGAHFESQFTRDNMTSHNFIPTQQINPYGFGSREFVCYDPTRLD